jgi:hypothetical protein
MCHLIKNFSVPTKHETKNAVKNHFVDSHLNFPPIHGTNMGNAFISMTEMKYQGKCSPSILADYCCLLRRDASVVKEYKHKP